MLVVTYENTSFTSKPACTELDQYIPVRPCGAEEADQKLVRHALNLLRNGYKSILIRTIDTDVLNLLISYFSQFELDDVNVYAYMINSNKYFNIKAIIQKLGPVICRALPLFYALSGCDIVSSLYGKGKCKMFDIWLNSAHRKALIEILIQLGKSPTRITEHQMVVLEAYIRRVNYTSCQSL